MFQQGFDLNLGPAQPGAPVFESCVSVKLECFKFK